MTIADMIAQRKIALDCILNDSNNAISAKGGTVADNLSGLQDAIVSIPTGSELPELTDPAEVGHVVAGKEYIDGNGDKKSGTLVVCDTVYEVETLTYPGTGLTVELESSADGSNKTMTLPEPNLKSENIVAGSSIFGVQGSAKTLRVETGTITPAKDITTLELPCTESPNMIVVAIAEESLTEVISQKINAMLYASCTNVACKSGADGSWVDTYRSTCTVHTASGSATYSSATLQLSPNVTLSAANSNFPWRAGCVYKWTAYYWEDSV